MRVDFFNIFAHTKAQMVELVDTLVSGTSERKLVQVRVLFWAQIRGCFLKETASFIR